MPVLMITLIIYLLYVVLGNGVLQFGLGCNSVVAWNGHRYPGQWLDDYFLGVC